MPASPEFIDEPIVEDDDAVRTVMSALLSGEHAEDSCLEYAASLCRARADAAPKLLALANRYRGLGRLSATQQQRIVSTIDQVLSERRRTDDARRAQSTTINGTRPVDAPSVRASASASSRESDDTSDDTLDLSQFVAQATGRQPQTAAALRPRPDATAPATPSAATPIMRAASRYPAPSLTEPSTGLVLSNRYQLLQPLGRGGRAHVFEAVDAQRVRLELEPRRVAVKIVACRDPRPDRASLAREFQDTQRLSHPNIIRVYDFDADARYAFYTMELLDGEALSQILKQLNAPLPRPIALTIICDIADAMVHAHARGVVHSDLKPQNIMLTRDGQVRVLDFGGTSTPKQEPWISELSSDTAFRPTTPAYASCQRLEGANADPRDDIYALACIAYQLLTAQHPFNQLSSLQARARGLRARRVPGLSARSWRALRSGLAWDRAQRPADVTRWLSEFDLSEALERLPPLPQLTAAVSKRRRPGPTLLLVALLIGVALLLAGLWRSDLLTVPGTTAATPAPPDAVAAAVAPAVPSRPAATAAASQAQPAATAHSTVAPAALPAPAALRALPPQEAAAATDLPVAAPAAATSAHLEFEQQTVDVAPGEPAAHVIIRRTGDTSKNSSFVWWTQDQSAHANVDYASLGRRTEQLSVGQDSVTLFVPIISNPDRHQAVSFAVVLGAEGADERDGSRATVTIEPDVSRPPAP